MATRVSVNGGASGVGLPSTTSTPPTSNNDLSQNLESNSSFDSDIIPAFLPDSQTKKRRKQSRPSRIPLSDSDVNPLNLSKGSSTPPSSFYFNQPPFTPCFTSAPLRDTADPSTPPEASGGGSGGSHGSSINSSTREQGALLPQPQRIFNPEAYCALCNKEFCNKYFLKTHKANKHGVYTEPPPTNGSYAPLPATGDVVGRHGNHRSAIDAILDEDRDDDTEEGDNVALTCHICGSDFTTEAELRGHLGEKHGLVVPPFVLPFPPSTNTPPTSLFDLPKNSPSEAFDCSRCSRSFSNLHLLRMHISYFHPPTPPPHNNNKEEPDSIKEECLSPEETGERTSDSDELRRLQSMIMDLNPLTGSMTCEGGPTSSWNNGSSPPHNAGHSLTNHAPAICPFCAKDFYSSIILAQHMEQSHGGAVKEEDASKTASEQFLLPSVASSAVAIGTPSSSSSSLKGDRRPSPSLSRSYCTICHKELCNKYFMRTHMLKMHGISIDSSTGLGGVTCDICNKELCSKYFLKVHKQNTHGILEEGPSPPAEPPEPPPSTPGVQAQHANSTEVLPLDLHAAFEVCSICSKRCRSVNCLRKHLSSEHGQEGKDALKLTKRSVPLSPKSNNGKVRSRGSRVRNGTSDDEAASQQRLMLDPLSIFFGKLETESGTNPGARVYRCSYCPFTTTVRVYHYAHERTHTGLGAANRLLQDVNTTANNLQCPMCFQGVGSFEAFQQHVFSHGILPAFLPQPPPTSQMPPTPSPQVSKCRKLTQKRKRLVFKCSACKQTFAERSACLGHFKRSHRRGGKKIFRCRKCSFTSGTYAKWRVHFKVHHTRPPKMFEVLGGGGDGVVLQRFLLGVGEDEPFVPSLLYLPVRSKVSESRNVSFSLTPRS